MDWTLFDSPPLKVTAELEGVLISRHEKARPSSSSRLERVLPALLMQLEDMEIGNAQSKSSWLIPYSQFVQLEANGIDATIAGQGIPFPNLGWEVRVARERAEEARRIIDEARASGPSGAEEDEAETEG